MSAVVHGTAAAEPGAAAAEQGAATAAPAAAATPTVVHYDELPELGGTALGTSSWRLITQEMIDAFAKLTDDEQWIHVDPVRAADGPFSGTIAHGYLTMCLSTSMVSEVIALTGVGAVINYGSDQVRFTAPVPSGSRVRAHVELVSARRRGRQFTQVIFELVYEIEATGDTACTARIVTLFSPEEPAVAATQDSRP
jgi:acyl dehydratase